jgi:hypothetical protein
MTWLWWIAPLVVAGFGVLLFASGVANLFTGLPMKGSRGLAGGALFTAIGLAGSLLGLNLQTYSRLTYERPVAEVTVAAVDPEHKIYNVMIHRLDTSDRSVTCQLQGDEWLLGARVQKWKPWANVLGLDATYELDQVANKYYAATEASGKPITACDIETPEPVVNQYVPDEATRFLVSLLQAEDRRFGSANYMPLADGARYTVVMTQSGLNSEAANEAARAAYAAHP